jgi:hypothetical protein
MGKSRLMGEYAVRHVTLRPYSSITHARQSTNSPPTTLIVTTLVDENAVVSLVESGLFDVATHRSECVECAAPSGRVVDERFRIVFAQLHTRVRESASRRCPWRMKLFEF